MRRLAYITATIVIFVIMACGLFILFNRNTVPHCKQSYIAHAGGAIDGYKYTNTLEAVLKSIDEGFKYIELDFDLTSDSVLVAVHDWQMFDEMTDSTGRTQPIKYSDFMSRKIYSRYQPLSASMVDSIFKAHPGLTLVTDKTDDIDILKEHLPSLKGRMLVECFSDEAYDRVKASGFATPMRSGIKSVSECSPLDFAGYYTINYEEYEAWKNSLSLKLINRVFNYPLAVYILGDDSTKPHADEIMAKDRYVRLVYIDEL